MSQIHWGYADSDRKRKPVEKLHNAMQLYRSIHGHDATHVRLHASLVREIPDPPLILVAHAVPPHSFFLFVGDAS